MSPEDREVLLLPPGAYRKKSRTRTKTPGGDMTAKQIEPPKNSLEWLKTYRPAIYREMSRLAVDDKESPALRRRRERLAVLMKEVGEAGEYIRERCPHLLENQRHTEHGREDTLGNLKSVWHVIVCDGCGQRLVDWTD